MKPVYLLLGALAFVPNCARADKAQTPTVAAEKAQRERDATAAALVRLMSEAIELESDKSSADKLGWKSLWKVSYFPSLSHRWSDLILVQRDQDVERPYSPSYPNSPGLTPEGAVFERSRPNFLLRIEPYLSPTEHARLQAKNEETYQQLRNLDAQMKDIKRERKSGKYLPADEAERRRVDAYEKLEATLTRKLPDFYFRDISLSWASGFPYFSSDYGYGYDPEYVLKTLDKTGWELEQTQVAQAVVRLLTRYEAAK